MKMESVRSSSKTPRTYVGEIRNLKREGYGVYIYENQFFKYEGEWKNGKKHGRGRLVMKDGSFYEGEFQDGEIEGKGCKYFAGSGSTYTGEFHKGELHGRGVMQYKDGSQFDGQWVFNKRQGHGILKASEKAVYEGAFYGNMRHGEGTQTYENGDWYRGGWVLDKREGYGEFRSADGTFYRGHWKSDVYDGEGRIEHCSGLIYEGEWFNGFPTCMATKLVIVAENNEIEINHGDKFSIKVECQNEKDEVIQKDQGRELQIIAGFKYTKPQPGSSLFDLIEDMADKPIPTPFGYEVVPFPLTNYLTLLEEEERQKALEEAEAMEAEEKRRAAELKAAEIDGANPDNPSTEAVNQDAMTGTKEASNLDKVQSTYGEVENSDPESKQPSENETTKDQTETRDQIEWRPLPQPENLRTLEGCCEWVDITLAPPPPSYSAFKEGGFASQPKNVKPTNRKSKAAIPPKGPRNEEYVIIVQDVTSPSFMEKTLEPAYVLLQAKRKKYIPKREPKPKWDTSKLIASASRNQEEEEEDAN